MRVSAIATQWKGSRFLRFPPLPKGRWPVLFFSIFSTLFGLWFVFNMDIYLPWQARLTRAIELTLLGHSGLWLAVIGSKGKLRFLIGLSFLPSMAVVFFLWWNLHLSLAISALVYMSWILYRTFRGTHFGD